MTTVTTSYDIRTTRYEKRRGLCVDRVIDKNDNPTFKNSKFIATIKGTMDDFKKLKQRK